MDHSTNPGEQQPRHLAEDGPADGPRIEAQKSQSVGNQARAEGQRVRATAQEQAGQVTQEASRQARNVVADAKAQLHLQAREQTGRLGGLLESLSGDAAALADGRPHEAGELGQYAAQAAERLGELARQVNELGFDGVIDEARRFARRRPGMFLVGAAVAGFAVSRLGRGVRDDDEATNGPTAEGHVDQPTTGLTAAPAGRIESTGVETFPEEAAAQPVAPTPESRQEWR